MLWLAWKIANAGPVEGGSEGRERPMTFLEAAAFQWVNPKAWAMALTAVATYTQPANYLMSLLMVGGVFGVINWPSVGVWAGFGVALRQMLQDPVKVRVFNIAMALLLVASLAPAVTELVRG
jgi:threonine/homoserine/homoserine lactone efflux protein